MDKDKFVGWNMYLIIVNPKAGRGLSILRLPVLTSFLDSRKISYEVHITTKPNDGYVQTLAFLRRSTCMGVIGLGGDGIIQEIVTAMVDAYPRAQLGEKIPIPLGILPTGSCNDFVSTLEDVKYSPKERYKPNPKAIIEKFVDRVLSRNLKQIDVITANQQAFINIGHVGLDTLNAMLAQKYHQKFDEYAYWIGALEGIIKYKTTPLIIETEKEKLEGRYTLLAVCNGKYYGFGVMISPSAELDDGIMNLTVVDTISKIAAAISLYKLAKKNYQSLKQVKFLTCKELRLTVPATTLCLDGNFYPVEGVINFKVLPRVLELF